MPFFEVIKGQDAYVEYSTVVEAINEEEARLHAGTWSYDGTWIANGNVPEFDHSNIFENRTTEIQAVSFEEAVKQIHDAYDYVELRLTPAELAHIHGKISSDLLTYLTHHARGALFPHEIEQMKWLKKLDVKFKEAAGA